MAVLALHSSRVLDISELQDAPLIVSSAALTARSSTAIVVRGKTIFKRNRKWVAVCINRCESMA
jgi:hypothetical protein